MQRSFDTEALEQIDICPRASVSKDPASVCATPRSFSTKPGFSRLMVVGLAPPKHLRPTPAHEAHLGFLHIVLLATAAAHRWAEHLEWNTLFRSTTTVEEPSKVAGDEQLDMLGGAEWGQREASPPRDAPLPSFGFTQEQVACVCEASMIPDYAILHYERRTIKNTWFARDRRRVDTRIFDLSRISTLVSFLGEYFKAVGPYGGIALTISSVDSSRPALRPRRCLRCLTHGCDQNPI
ncbi:hypothetical protein EVAR_4568_1 [Eumeta japonica]|uniref:Uncharacterized protein n=1 Tax=Eumeta variegata TaxID=151549 RepID=A0A4C1SWV9_EUMVA|nr:hypothetical protein EVAR_4568_1 [Eumeta japonica]